jgi:hypothetical protein
MPGPATIPPQSCAPRSPRAHSLCSSTWEIASDIISHCLLRPPSRIRRLSSTCCPAVQGVPCSVRHNSPHALVRNDMIVCDDRPIPNLTLMCATVDLLIECDADHVEPVCLQYMSAQWPSFIYVGSNWTSTTQVDILKLLSQANQSICHRTGTEYR